MSEQFILTLPKETEAFLEELSKATGKTKTLIAVEAIERYLELEAWQIKAIQKGVQSADCSELIPIEEIESEWNN